MTHPFDGVDLYSEGGNYVPSHCEKQDTKSAFFLGIKGVKSSRKCMNWDIDVWTIFLDFAMLVKLTSLAIKYSLKADLSMLDSNPPKKKQDTKSAFFKA